MVKRNTQDLDMFAESIRRLNNYRPTSTSKTREFNCPDIDWDTLTVNGDPKVQDRNIQQQLIDLSFGFDLTQIHDQRTRNNNFLILGFTTDP